MAIHRTPESAPSDVPVHYTPPGAAPRGLRTDPFVSSGGVPPSPPPEGREAVSGTPNNREWDFAMPATAPSRQLDPHLDPDTNWRRQVGLRAPVETLSFPETTKERFNENRERLASEPRTPRRGQLRRNLEKSWCTRWLFNHGRFDPGTAAGPVLLILLLTAVTIYGVRVLANSGKQHLPAAKATTTGGK